MLIWVVFRICTVSELPEQPLDDVTTTKYRPGVVIPLMAEAVWPTNKVLGLP